MGTKSIQLALNSISNQEKQRRDFDSKLTYKQDTLEMCIFGWILYHRKSIEDDKMPREMYTALLTVSAAVIPYELYALKLSELQTHRPYLSHCLFRLFLEFHLIQPIVHSITSLHFSVLEWNCKIVPSTHVDSHSQSSFVHCLSLSLLEQLFLPKGWLRIMARMKQWCWVSVLKRRQPLLAACKSKSIYPRLCGRPLREPTATRLGCLSSVTGPDGAWGALVAKRVTFKCSKFAAHSFPQSPPLPLSLPFISPKRITIAMNDERHYISSTDVQIQCSMFTVQRTLRDTTARRRIIERWQAPVHGSKIAYYSPQTVNEE